MSNVNGESDVTRTESETTGTDGTGPHGTPATQSARRSLGAGGVAGRGCQRTRLHAVWSADARNRDGRHYVMHSRDRPHWYDDGGSGRTHIEGPAHCRNRSSPLLLVPPASRSTLRPTQK